jgi:hypothetical protein
MFCRAAARMLACMSKPAPHRDWTAADAYMKEAGL